MKRLLVICMFLAACGNGSDTYVESPPDVQSLPLGPGPAIDVPGQPETDLDFSGTGMDGPAEDESDEEDKAKVPDMCGADERQDLLGQPLDLHRADMPEGSRFIEPGSIITQDYRPQRLNVNVDDKGSISRIWCG